MVSTALLEEFLLNTSSSSESNSSDEEWLACLEQFDKLDKFSVNCQSQSNQLRFNNCTGVARTF